MKITLANLVLVSLLVMSAAASAQQSASSGLVGQVTDASQAAIPGATVTVTNVGTNAQRTTVTDGEGRFSVPALPPATYHIKVELQGFQTAELAEFRPAARRDGAPDDHAGGGDRQRSHHGDGRSTVAADAERLGRPGDQREA